MKPIPWGKNEKDYYYCEMQCAGYESHTGRCVGWALFGEDYPRHPERKFCLSIEKAWEICPKKMGRKLFGSPTG